ncbi:MAG: L-fucose:H+ symporter permease [Bacteroidota bacterium]
MPQTQVKRVPVVARQYLVPFILLTSLFALWGFANDITNPMVSAFKKVLELDNFKASWVQFAFYFGYFTMALPAAYFIKRYSYKRGIVIGLGLYATGALLFFPAAANESFTFFLLALYILTFGLAFLETTANPYVLALGDEKTAVQRLNLAQAFNPVGALMGLFVAQTFILGALQSDDLGAEEYAGLESSAKAAIRSADLEVIRNPYVALGVVVLLMLALFLVIKMPKGEEQESSGGMWAAIKRLWSQPKFVGGVLAQMFYVGAQIMVWTFIYQYAENIGINNQDAVYFAMSALGVFLVGRWVCTLLLRYVSSSLLLSLFAVGALLATLGAIFMVGESGLYSLVAISFFMSLMFPTIYGLALEGQGDDAKFGAAFLVMAIVGGALMPPMQASIMDIGGKGYADTLIAGVPEVNFSFILPAICFVLVAIYGLLVHRNLLKN